LVVPAKILSSGSLRDSSIRGRQDNPEAKAELAYRNDKGNGDTGFTYGASQLPRIIRKLEKEMKEAAKSLDFERAAALRDQLKVLQEEKQKGRKN